MPLPAFLIHYGMPYGTRELSTNYQSQTGFLTCVWRKNPSHPSRTVGQLLSVLLIFISNNAYSGATVTDFHRVPFSAIRYFILKEQSQLNAGKRIRKRKIYFSIKITISSIAIAKVQTERATIKTHIKRLCCVFKMYLRYLSDAEKVLLN